MIESALERWFVREVVRRGGLCLKFVSPANPGVPDRIVITPDGRIIFVELKTEVGRLSAIQRWQRQRFIDHGADSRVVKGREQATAFLREVFG